MLRFPTNYLILEGPDLSGKTTFYANLHRASGYKWNIQDRSCMSMLIHARQYGRDSAVYEENFKLELLNLNNRFVIMLPDFNDIVIRYSMRGDEIQSLDDIKGLYKEFEKYAEDIQNLPNVTVLRSSDLNTNIILANEQLNFIESANLPIIAQHVKEYAANSKDFEATPLSFTIYDNGEFEDARPSVMNYEKEAEYYSEILTGMLRKIRNEFLGRNIYNLPQTKNSRRFVYCNDACITLIHATYRDKMLDMHFVLRSSEVKTTFEYDLEFLYYLSSMVYKELNLQPKKDAVRMRFNLNSAHILV